MSKYRFPNGKYVLGLAPTENEDGKPLYSITLQNNNIIAFETTTKQLEILKASAQWLISSCECCLKDDRNAIYYRYWLVKSG